MISKKQEILIDQIINLLAADEELSRVSKTKELDSDVLLFKQHLYKLKEGNYLK